MTSVGLWIKQLVLVVLLAVFADMLLPTKSMQRYVRLVLGLAVIAVMVKPVLPLFRQDWAGQMASQLSAEWSSNATMPAGLPTPDLRGFADTLQQQQQQDADVALASQLSQQVTNTFQVQVQQATVSGASLTAPNLSATLVLAPNTPQLIVARIRQFVATQMGIAQDHVHVRIA